MNSNLLYDWNNHDIQNRVSKKIEINDETLRDGLQAVSFSSFSLEQMYQFIEDANKLQITTINLGMPGAGDLSFNRVRMLAKYISERKLNIKMNVACLAKIEDVQLVEKIMDEIGQQIEICIFIGASSIRRFVEDWTLNDVISKLEPAVKRAVKTKSPVMLVTEDTSRTSPEDLELIYKSFANNGINRICVCDTVGYNTTYGVSQLIKFVKNTIEKTGCNIKIDYHGHNDRGLALSNALTAIDCGVDRIHATALGIGERCGNCSMEQLLINMKLNGYYNGDLLLLNDYISLISKANKIEIPETYPGFGKNAFRTQSGIHSAAIIKAKKKGLYDIANTIYSSVPAELIGRVQEIELGPMSGKSNVCYILDKYNIEKTDKNISFLLEKAKSSNHVFSSQEIESIIAEMK